MDIKCKKCGSRHLRLLNEEKGEYVCMSCDNVVSFLPHGNKIASAKEIYKKCIGGIVEISSYFKNESAFGTGFYVSGNGYIITNAHIVANKTQSDKFELPRSIYSGIKNSDDFDTLSLEYIDPKNDLALLKNDCETSIEPLWITDKALEIGDPVFTIGNSKGDGLVLLEGIVGDVNRTFGAHEAFLFTAAVTEGCSGGPVLNSDGDVCGVTVGGMNNTASMNFAIPVNILSSFIRMAKAEKGISF